MSQRRFPPPWSVEETAACFIVRDANGQALAFVYCEDEPGRWAVAKLHTRDEVRHIAANIAMLPELLRWECALSPPACAVSRPTRDVRRVVAAAPRSAFSIQMTCSNARA
jgi:hypothetical protein